MGGTPWGELIPSDGSYELNMATSWSQHDSPALIEKFYPELAAGHALSPSKGESLLPPRLLKRDFTPVLIPPSACPGLPVAPPRARAGEFVGWALSWLLKN